MPAGAHRLGARLPAAARCLSARALSPRARPRRVRPRCAILCWRGFPMAKRSRPICWWAPTASRSTVRQQGAARSRAALCRLLRLARADRGRRDFPPDVHRELFEYMTFTFAAGRAVPRLSGGGAGQRSASRPSPLQRGVVPAGRRDDQAAMAAHRRARHDARDFDSAAADPPRGDCRNARRCRAAGRGRSFARSCG